MMRKRLNMCKNSAMVFDCFKFLIQYFLETLKEMKNSFRESSLVEGKIRNQDHFNETFLVIPDWKADI